jgi:3-oxoadipate enol-lactonase
MDTITKKVTVDDGVELVATLAETRADAPGLLLVHGFGGAKEDFADHLEALARDHRVVVFDHRGHGESDGPDDVSAYSLERLARDTVAVADAFGFDTFRLLGHSMGGMVAQRIAIAEPDRVDALVLMDTSTGPPRGIDPQLVVLGAEIAINEGMTVLRELLDEHDPLASEAHQRVLAERPGFEEYGDYKWSRLSPAMWSALVVEITTQTEALGEIAAITSPTLVLVGDQDDTFIEPSFAMADMLPDARLVVIPDAGHSPQFENPAVWIAAVSGFLEELPVRR